MRYNYLIVSTDVSNRVSEKMNLSEIRANGTKKANGGKKERNNKSHKILELLKEAKEIDEGITKEELKTKVGCKSMDSLNSYLSYIRQGKMGVEKTKLETIYVEGVGDFILLAEEEI